MVKERAEEIILSTGAVQRNPNKSVVLTRTSIQRDLLCHKQFTNSNTTRTPSLV